MSRRADRLLLALVIALAAAGVVAVASQSRSARLAADFTVDYSAGVLLREGRLAAPYQQAELARTIRAVAPDSGIDQRLPYNLPLAAALPYAALSLLPLEAAFRLFQAISLGLVMAVVLLLQSAASLGRRAPLFAALGTLAAVPVWATLTEGQPTAFVLTGAGLVVVCLRFRLIGLAALGGGLLAVKPQYLPAYLAILLAAREWRLLLAALVGGTLMLLSPLAGGPGALLAMLHNALLVNELVSLHINESWVGLLAVALPTGVATTAAVLLDGTALLALAWVGWRRPSNLIAYAAIAGVLAVIASPHALPHDLILLAVPSWLTVRLQRDGQLPDLLRVWVLVDLALIVDLHGVPVPLAPIALTLLLGYIALRLHRTNDIQAMAA
ncbi:MAG TPA: glycosyltransferase family 87 protein [Candidatus Dormibacteraeota bacterium]|nr:glycosyltransferase family 87 protein [Candidatus Dormibacteraeota bacterium]